MIVVAIVGLLAAIAVPNFFGARQRAQTNLCIANLRHIEDAKSMWAVWEGKTSSDTPGWGDLVPAYLQTTPNCPQGGTYTIGSVDTKPVCSIAGHVLP
ncbi:MAG: prepilin-type cleavage/methylation domain-containing protein [Candidatus Makaraimicrobium thalassicum]|nr:MAG: prepilin-type cleavage/methylation domain-containing protein [Candidatus Omnitrophota bacterium]